MVGKIPADQLALHPDMGAQVKAGRGAVELWAGDFDQAAVTLSAAAAAAQNTGQRADCLGHLALLEALRGRLGRAAELAAPPAGAGRDNQARADESSSCAATVAMAYVHVERNELPEARRCLRRADEILQLCPDKLIGAVACLVAARGFLAQRRSGPVAALVGRARHGWSPAPWLEQRLLLAESQAHLAQGNIASAVEAARRAGADSSPEAAAALARAWLAGGNIQAARRALAGVPRRGTGSQITSACKPGWPTLSSAMRSGTAGARIACLSGLCGWPRASRCGCRSSWREAGSATGYGKIRAWPGPTVSC